MTSLQNYLNERPVITNKDAARIGVNRQLLSVLVKEGKLERLRPGVYQKAGEVIDDFMLVSANSNQFVFRMRPLLFSMIYQIECQIDSTSQYHKDITLHILRKDI